MRHLIIPVLAVSVMSLSTAPAHVDLGDQLAKLLADDGEEGDVFGFTVAISGTTAIVGARNDDDNGNQSGSAYLFDISDPALPTQLFKLLPDDGAEQDRFGVSVAISGITAIVGAYLDDDNGFESGSAYLFDTTTGKQLFKLVPNDGAEADLFGISVAISGTTAIVGTPQDDDNGSGSGSAYLFDTTTGQQVAKLLADDGSALDEFGTSVAISGATAIVGAEEDDENGGNSGSAYLFDSVTGLQIAKVLPNDIAEGDRFGTSVAICENIAIVGSPRDDDNGSASGSAYLFDATTGTQIAKLLPDDGAFSDFFGESVGISGTTVVIGAPFKDNIVDDSGSAYLFDISDPVRPAQNAKLITSDPTVDDFFGFFVAISGAHGNEIAIIGAVNDDDNGTNSGSAYLFDAASAIPCPWDVNGDGVVDFHDILEVVHNLGLCDDPDDCPWDVNGDGVVNGRDVAAVATHFGSCP